MLALSLYKLLKIIFEMEIFLNGRLKWTSKDFVVDKTTGGKNGIKSMHIFAI